MTTKRFFACVALACGVIVAFNVFLALKVDSVPKKILRTMQATPQIDILFLGNSLMQSGFDPDSFASAWPRPGRVPTTFNAGLGSSSPVEHYVLAHQTLMRHGTVKYLVYGFFDFQLTHAPDFKWCDLVGNRSMAYGMEPSISASLYAPGSITEKWRFLSIGAIPMLRDHSQLWKYVELLRRDLQQIGMPMVKTNEFGRVADFEAIAEPDVASFDEEAELAVTHSSPSIPAIEELLRLAQEHGARVLMVEMPAPPGHRNQYYSAEAWQKYQTYLQKQFQVQGVIFINASDWVPDDADFSDGLHLNAAGAKLFSRKIAQVMGDVMQPH